MLLEINRNVHLIIDLNILATSLQTHSPQILPQSNSQLSPCPWSRHIVAVSLCCFLNFGTSFFVTYTVCEYHWVCLLLELTQLFCNPGSQLRQIVVFSYHCLTCSVKNMNQVANGLTGALTSFITPPFPFSSELEK